MARTRRWTWVGLAVAAATVVLTETLVGGASRAESPGARLLLGTALAATVVLTRLRPAAGLVLALLVEAVVVVGGFDVATDDVVMGAVMYLCARHGARSTLWASGLVMPFAYVVTGAFLVNPGTEAVRRIDRAGLTSDPTTVVLLALTVAAPLALPWLLGVTLRWRARAERTRLALLRAEVETQTLERRAQLAHDVHDVVGHSLAVILAQASSVRYLDHPSPAQVQDVLDTIADSARASLTEVRQVLSGVTEVHEVSDLDAVISAIPAGLGTIHDRVVGRPRPLAPDTATVASRVLREMLTNAMKHGNGGTIEVVRDWRDGLRMVVTNEVDDHGVPSPDGIGLTSMRQRVTAAHGCLEVRREAGRFAVDAWLPPHRGSSA